MMGRGENIYEWGNIMDLRPFEKKVWLSSPTMHGEEIKYVTQAYDTNWMSTVGAGGCLSYIRNKLKRSIMGVWIFPELRNS